MGTKEYPSEALVGPCRRPRVRAASSPVGSHCSGREGFVTMGVASSHSPLLCCTTDTSENTLYSLYTHYPQNCRREPRGRHRRTHTACCPWGWRGVRWPSPGPSPCQGNVEANAVKPKKLLRRLQGRLACVCSRQLKWKPAPEVLCLAPPGQVPGFPYGLPGGGTGAVIRTSLPAPALACKSTNTDVPHVHGPCPTLCALQLSPGQRLPALEE